MLFTLIGMPGSGKTCMSKALANKINIKTLDTDRVIEAKVGKKLHEIISEQGLEEFRRIEEETLLTINEKNALLATGGSAVYYESVMNRFKENSVIVYLYISPRTLKERLGDFSKRGVVLEEGKTLDDLYAEREPLLRKYADITVSCDGRAYSKYQAELLSKLERRFKR